MTTKPSQQGKKLKGYFKIHSNFMADKIFTIFDESSRKRKVIINGLKETSSEVFLHGTICFLIFYKMKFGIFLEFWSLALLGVNGFKQVCDNK